MTLKRKCFIVLVFSVFTRHEICILNEVSLIWCKKKYLHLSLPHEVSSNMFKLHESFRLIYVINAVISQYTNTSWSAVHLETFRTCKESNWDIDRCFSKSSATKWAVWISVKEFTFLFLSCSSVQKFFIKDIYIFIQKISGFVCLFVCLWGFVFSSMKAQLHHWLETYVPRLLCNFSSN